MNELSLVVRETIDFFPVYHVTLQYHRFIGRNDVIVAMIEAYLQANEMFVYYSEYFFSLVSNDLVKSAATRKDTKIKYVLSDYWFIVATDALLLVGITAITVATAPTVSSFTSTTIKHPLLQPTGLTLR
ncbi:hypothetical protein M8C21_001881 [Ambrosia artemisiifolia]|uniref:Uncharacterized protein n=1 Tax=Ambrosia artemisiifolia TaxID=4212 RepID=A0AAD5GR59_AMBAR|nr:hypothetical protein M8C21_001881 [Ambrosia artemisiifolia]